MSDSTSIPGNPGTDPLTSPPAPASTPVATPSPRRPAAPTYDDVSTRPLASRRTTRGAARDESAVLEPAIEAARKHRDELLRLANVVDVRGGYKFVGGRITRDPAVVVVVTEKRRDVAADDRVPSEIDGIRTDVAVADPWERLRVARETEASIVVPPAPRLLIDELQGIAAGTEVEEAVPQIVYEPPPDGDLSPVEGAMTITCHVSPDAGWRVLSQFLDGIESELVLGMYDFTAPHIYASARKALKLRRVEWRQTLGPKESLPTEDDVDSTKADDKTEASVVRGLKRAGGDRFQHAFAHVGAGQTFASAYHIKVAVRDRDAFWLSSGNWQSSNQPAEDFLAAGADLSRIARFNREWHVVVENRELAERFRVFLEHDLATASEPIPETAALPLPELLIPIEELLADEEEAARELQAFEPLTLEFTDDAPITVQPILTPDNYSKVVLKMLRKRPRQRLFFQNQSLNPVKQPTEEFDEMMRLLVEYSNDDSLDVRLIFRNIGPVRKKLESLQAAGFNMSRVRMQSGCHTKGIIVDSETILLGSHNFTNQGILVNRDASLLMSDRRIARYYERIFLHDWARLARPTIREEAALIPVGTPGAEAAALDGREYARVSWRWMDED